MPVTPSPVHRILAATLALLLPGMASDPLRVVSISDSPRDTNAETGSGAMLNHLEAAYQIKLRHIDASAPQADLAELQDHDVILFHPSGRIPGETAGRLREALETGPPLVSLRGAVHAFGDDADFAVKVLGARHGGQFEDGATTRTRPTQPAVAHPVFDGVSPIRSRHPLHRFEDFATDAVPLMIGAVAGSPPQTVAWARTQVARRIFHTSLGGELDLENDSVKRLVANALFWAAGSETRRIPPPQLARWERKQGDFTVPLRSREQRGDHEGAGWRESIDPLEVPVDVAALVIADMRDAHWCRSAQEWIDANAEAVNALASAARSAGMLLVHVPSGISGFYDDHPARRRIEQVAGITVEGNYPIEPITSREIDLPPIPLPNEDCPGGGTRGAAWTRQHPAIHIHETDIISGVGRQIYSYLLGAGIDTLFYVGVHANTTMLDRSHGIREMSAWGMDCILVRDMTDIMFDPGTPVEIPHETARERVVEHLERHLLSTVSSGELIEALSNMEP